MSIRGIGLVVFVRVRRGGAKIVSEYYQEIPQSQTTDNPMAPRGKPGNSKKKKQKKNRKVDRSCINFADFSYTWKYYFLK